MKAKGSAWVPFSDKKSAPRVARVCLGGVLAIGAVMIASVLNAQTLTVSRTGPFFSIQEAIRAASPGDTIRVESGVYEGNLDLDRPVTLVGIGKPVIRGTGKSSVIKVSADGCTIRGLVIENSGGMLVDEDSGILLRSNQNSVEENELRDVLFGLYLFNSNNNKILRNAIRGRGFLQLGERGSGIHIWNSKNNEIVANTIREVRDGMYLQNADQSIIRENRISDLRYGLHYMFSNDNTFEGNLFYNNVAGAAIMYSRRIQFRRNAFVHNRGFSSFGILYQDSQECLAENNFIIDNAVGIFMEALRDSTFQHNLIAVNDIAVQAFSSASENIFRENNFIANLCPLQVIGRSTETHWSQSGSGNYWSDYEGYDLDGDGVGDVPYKIQNVFEHLEGNFPRLRLYLFSPASQALTFAEKTFPVLERSREFDNFPMMRPVKASCPLPEPGGPGSADYSLLPFPVLMLVISVAFMMKGRWS